MPLISTEHQPGEVVQVEEESQQESDNDDGQVRIVQRCVPIARRAYLTLSKFIDQTNDLISGQQPRTHATTRWKTATILWLLKLVISNARVIWNSVRGGETKTLKEMMIALANELSPLLPLDLTHSAVQVPENDRREHRCFMRESCNRRTRLYCITCQVFFCTDCFNKFTHLQVSSDLIVRGVQRKISFAR